jgi:CHASE2 domain-containing sensor protein
MNLFSLIKQILREAWRVAREGEWSIDGFKARIKGLHNLVMSWAAMLSRQMGNRAILLIGIGASFYAIFLFISNQITPEAPKASHDTILKTRWASPKPSPSIIIVDIDERSLAALSPEHGRWPWARNVFADGLDRLSQAGAKAVLFNVLITDADKFNPDADSALEAVAAMLPNVAYPLVRLNMDNDQGSQLKVSDLFKYTGDLNHGTDATVAVLLPMFEPMLAKAGIANQKPDTDGIVRRYPIIWSDDRLTMPSIVARTLDVGGDERATVPPTITLNWRNKGEVRYRRVSFSDLLNTPAGASELSAFKDAYVVLGVSAPGLGMTKPTAVSSLEDDNEILATALDDTIHGTYLRVMPPWLVLVIELAAVWSLVWFAIGRSWSPLLTKAFLLVQSGAATITMFTASYTNYLIDLSAPMAFGAGLYGAIRLVKSLDDGWSRARPGLRTTVPQHQDECILFIGYRDSQITRQQSAELQQVLEKHLGLTRVIRVDDLFGGESFARKVCEDYSCQFGLAGPTNIDKLKGSLTSLPFFISLDIQVITNLVPWDPEDEKFRLFIAPYLLRQCADLMD